MFKNIEIISSRFIHKIRSWSIRANIHKYFILLLSVFLVRLYCYIRYCPNGVLWAVVELIYKALMAIATNPYGAEAVVEQ